MFQDMFGSFSSGRIGRLRFVGLTILLALVFAIVGISLGGFAAISEKLSEAGGAAPYAPRLGGAGLLVFLIAGIALFVGTLNLVAKRARDIGWSPVLLIILYLFFNGITWIVLALVSGSQKNGD